MGISSTSDKATTFYVDNLKMGTAEDLAKPIVRAPRRPRTAKPQEPPNADKLVGYWKLDEGGGSIAEDKSGCQNEGDMWANWSTAALGSAMRCDAVDSYMAIADSPTLRLGKSDFTIELWLYPTQLDIDSTQKRRRFLSKSDYPKTWVVLDVTTDGKISTQMTDAAKVSFSATGRGQIHENQWAHVAVVGNRKRGDVSFYINGILDSLHGVPPALGSLDVEGKELTIGSTWQPFIGLIDEVKIYKRALSPEEIEASYSKQKAMHSGTNYKAAE
jgi:hypothetical protein